MEENKCRCYYKDEGLLTCEECERLTILMDL
jgi:hypothetical protein